MHLKMRSQGNSDKHMYSGCLPLCGHYITNPETTSKIVSYNINQLLPFKDKMHHLLCRHYSNQKDHQYTLAIIQRACTIKAFIDMYINFCCQY